STVTLNVGMAQGITSNQPVLTLDGLLGKTASVATEASVVHLITDRNFRLSVKVGAEGLRGILQPLYGQRGEIIGIPPNSGIVPGDRVLTSGFSDIYPKNLPVGEVEEILNIPGEAYGRVRVRLYADPQNAEHVFVMVRNDTGS
ncbi:MAG: rod shape-determining protein MreC, partial [Candidatus Neomarinimicrobiota bacterium]